MKRMVALLAAVLCLPLVGCRAGREADRRFMVSALGFDFDGAELTLSAEMLIVNSESTGEDISTQMFTATGANAKECIFNLSQGMSKDIQLAHCGMIAVGESVTGGAFDGIIEYCTENREINLSAYLTETKNAGALLSGKALSALTVGYELMGFLEHYSDQTGIEYGCRIYEVQAARLRKTPVFTLPRFSSTQDNFTLEGAAVYINNRAVLRLSPDETAVYSLVNGNHRGGQFCAGDKVYSVKSPHTYFRCGEKGSAADIKLDIKIAPDGADSALCDYIKNCANGLLQRSQGEDIFGLADRIYAENADLWKKFENGTVRISFADIGILCGIRRADYAK